MVGKKFNFDEEYPEHLNPSDAANSFKKMLSNNKKDLVDVALKEMGEHIEAKAADVLTK